VATFCLLHGAWHDPACWDPLMAALRARGHDARAPELPLHDPASGYAQRVAPAIEAVADVAEPVMVVGHSQSSALGPLVAVARPTTLLVHLCPRFGPFEPPAGGPAPFRESIPMPKDRPDGTSAWDTETAIEAMYPRLRPEDAQALAERLRPMAMPAGDYPLPSHPDVPTALIYAADDEFFDPEWERFMARELLGVEPIELPGGHFLMVEDPDGLADVLDRLAPD
jgi:pimeloyl-ACP methyl ester carboxylesterase